MRNCAFVRLLTRAVQRGRQAICEASGSATGRSLTVGALKRSEMNLNLKLPNIARALKGMLGRLARDHAGKSAQETGMDPGIPRVLAISKDQEFLALLRKMSVDSTWEFFQTSSLTEALNALTHEYFPIVVLDQGACERAWEASVAAVVHLRRVPCVILASEYEDEYARLEVIRLGGYDVLNKLASPDSISRTIEFAWFWSQYSPRPWAPTPPMKGSSN